MESYLCACGKKLPEPLERVGNLRALCPCGQQARLDDDAQAAYAERAGSHKPEPPRAAPPEASVPSDADPAPGGAGRDAGAAPAGAWSEAEISAEVQLPAEAEAQVEDEPPAPPPPPRRAGDTASWVAG